MDRRACWTGSSSRRTGRGIARRSLFLLLSVVVTASCGVLPGRGGSDLFDAGRGADLVTVEVRNDHEGDAEVFALWNGDRHRVGFVAAGEEERFQVRWRSQELAFQVELTGGRNFATQPVLMSRTGSIHVVIPETLD